MPDTHARLSCSAAKRWINCPGSVLVSEKFPQTSSSYAEEGTFAHSLAETILGGKVPGTKFKKEVDAFYELHPELGGSYAEMEDYIKGYCEFVLEELTAQLHEDLDADMMTEQRVDLNDYIEGGFGTSDTVIVREGFLHIIDLKYGKGVPVSAEDNPQLRLYALGTLSMLDPLYEITQVRMTIYQPRLDNISTDEMPAADLYTWGEEVVRPAAELALQPGAPFASGSWCQFCPARGTCRARTDHFQDIGIYQGKELLTNEELSLVLKEVDDLVKWATDVKDATLAKIMAGEEVPGWKAVEGRSIRRFCGSEADIVKAADSYGYSKALLYETKMLSLSAIEKVMGKKDFAAAMDGLVEKPQGRPTLAPESDKRKALVVDRNAEAAEDFA